MIFGLTKYGSDDMFRIERGWRARAAFTRLMLAALVLSLGAGDARAESAQAQPAKPAARAQKKAPKKDKQAAAAPAPKGAPSSAYVPIVKPDGSEFMPMRRTQMSDRMNAGIRRWEAERARKQKPGSTATESSGGSGLRSALTSVMKLALAQTAPPAWTDLPKPIDYYNVPNYAYSKLPTATCMTASTATSPSVSTGQACTKDSDCTGYKSPVVVGVNIYPGGETCTGAVQSGGVHKFVDSLALLCPQGKSTLDGNCLPIATPDTTTYADADYYELGLKDFTMEVPHGHQRHLRDEGPRLLPEERRPGLVRRDERPHEVRVSRPRDRRADEPPGAREAHERADARRRR